MPKKEKKSTEKDQEAVPKKKKKSEKQKEEDIPKKIKKTAKKKKEKMVEEDWSEEKVKEEEIVAEEEGEPEEEDEEEELEEVDEEKKPKKKPRKAPKPPAEEEKEELEGSKVGGEGIAKFAFIAGIVAAVASFINVFGGFIPFVGPWCTGCFLGPVGGLAFLAGVILGIVSLVMGAGNNKKKAIIGLVLCGVAFFLWVVYGTIRTLLAFVF